MSGLCEIIERRVTEEFRVSLADLRGEDRHRRFARPRQVAMYLIRMHTTMSLPQIGNRLGGKDHTTALAGIRRVEKLMREKPKFAEKIESLRQSLVNVRPVHEGLAALVISEALATFDASIFEIVSAVPAPHTQALTQLAAANRDTSQRPLSSDIRPVSAQRSRPKAPEIGPSHLPPMPQAGVLGSQPKQATAGVDAHG